MKVKEVACTANIAWSPAEQHPIYIAAGTAAQQLDATFSTTASLDIYALNMEQAGLEMEKKASLSTKHRFYKILWGKHGMSDGSLPNGIIAGGTDNGSVYLYDASKLLSNEEALITKTEQHTGSVKALDFNPFQGNLLATGASDSEIFIWDLNSPTNPMTPGAKAQPLDEISCVAWNRQVQHILASTSPGGQCIVWDLKKNEPIIKVTDHSSRIRCKAVVWHPDIATQMLLASEDDHMPVIQVWDLRFATSPLKVLENHQRGVLSMNWCQQDPDLLLSCGKDNRILVWNPNSAVQGGEVLYELPTTTQWSFDVQWCPRNPCLIANSSFDGHISVYSLMGGGGTVQAPQDQHVNQLVSSFPGMEPMPVPQQQVDTQTKAKPVLLKKPPKWLKRPAGASFGFGGKLLSFQQNKAPANQQPAHSSSSVFLSQVVTEPELVSRSKSLEEALSQGQFCEFCDGKIAKAVNNEEAEMWKFLKVSFEQEPRKHVIGLLGYDTHDLARKVALATGASMGLTNGVGGESGGVDATELAERMQELSSGTTEPEADLGSGSKTPNDDGEADGAAAFDAIAAGGMVEVENQAEEEDPDSGMTSPLIISREADTDGLISQSLLTGNFEAAVEMCLHDNRLADAILLAIAGGPELLAKTQRKYFKKTKSNVSRLISSVVTKDLGDIVKSCEIENWKEALTALLTYSSAKEFSTLCDTLAERLEMEKDGALAREACLCYICSGNVDRLVACWSKLNKGDVSPLSLQDIVEKVMILKKSVEVKKGETSDGPSPNLAKKMSDYAQLLAAQGSLTTAVNYLNNSQDQQILELKERLQRALYGAAHKEVQQQRAKQFVQQRTAGQQQSHQEARPFTTQTVSSSQYFQPQMSHKPHNASPYINQSAQQPMNQQPPQQAISRNKLPSQGRYPSYPTPTMNQYYSPGIPSQTSHEQQYSQQQQQQSPSYPQNAAGGQHQVAPSSTPSYYNPGAYTPQSTAAQVPQQAPSESQPPPPPSNYAPPPQGPAFVRREGKGWNEPPALKQKEAQSRYVAPAPITAPIIGAPEEEYPPAAPVQGYQGSQQQQQVPQGYNAGGEQQPPSQTANQPAPEPEKPKAPIPSEHQILCEVFDALAKRCMDRGGSNPQMKRKLDDVSRKLGILYDRLREGRVSQMISQGLHQIIAAIQAYDYHEGLRIYTHLVSSGNFSEISAFMPGLKVLLQVANQLKV
ncbi:protein transport protein Sec31A-like isoform X2 [Apostichopus japonicus]|uniref:protein transport protein Sec31A-like isoform X2 n=1 Tax=Stichopus japonicus TaxID=307972 RepID=UPI003AB3687C